MSHSISSPGAGGPGMRTTSGDPKLDFEMEKFDKEYALKQEELDLKRQQFALDKKHAHLKAWGIPILVAGLTLFATLTIGGVTAYVNNVNFQRQRELQKAQVDRLYELEAEKFENSLIAEAFSYCANLKLPENFGDPRRPFRDCLAQRFISTLPIN